MDLLLSGQKRPTKDLWALNKTASELRNRDSLGLERFFEVGFNGPNVDAVTTGEDIDGGVLVFRPGVYGEVRLRNDQDSTHSLGGKLVESLVDDRGAPLDGRFSHGFLNEIWIVKEVTITVVAFHQDLDSKRLHGGEGGFIRADVNGGWALSTQWNSHGILAISELHRVNYTLGLTYCPHVIRNGTCL